MATHPSAARRGLRGRILTLAVGLAASSLALGACASSTQTASVDDDGAAASHGEISVQYSWIKNEEFAGEFYAYENGYYDEAGFSDVIGISGPDTGVAKLLSGTVQVALSDAASIGAAIAEQEAPLKIIGTTFQKNPFTILSLADKGNILTPEDLVGKTIGESGLWDRDITVLTLHRGTNVIPNPRKGVLLEAGDRLLCFGKLEEMRSMIPERRRRRAKVRKLPAEPIPSDEP